MTFYIRELSPRGELQNIFLSDARDPARHITYTARKALLIRGETAPTLIMLDGMAQVLDRTTRLLSVTRFEDFAFDLTGLVDISAGGRVSARELGTGDLLRATVATQALTGETRSALVSKAHERFSNSFNSLVAPMIGFATLLLGGFSRFGIWRQILGAIAALIAMQMLTQVGQGIVRSDADAWLAAYIGPAAGAVLVLVLLNLAARPALLRKRNAKVSVAGAET